MMDKKDFLKCQPVVMEEMLIAREKRSSIQRELLNQYKLPLISFTLNISGSYKTFPLAEKSFEEGKKLIRNHLRRNKILIKHEEDNSSKTGYEYYIVADNNPNFIKKLMLEIENSSLLGRIFDIDVLKEDGNKITRDEIGETNRACILCNNMAHVCSRSRKHSQEELINKIIEIMYDYFNQKFANMCSACACKALLYEVITTPKPGLVD
ncbi:MAG: citrate lyase holo-[acyl-carrier protein] synthase, partial [Clostridiales bacterium]|nr:citrate lyase holo-[acyl-carrier protein] synthase [Clostridiales bacterium]